MNTAIASLRPEMTGAIGTLRTEMTGAITALRSDTRDWIAGLRHSQAMDRVWMLLALGAMLGVMARGFKWI